MAYHCRITRAAQIKKTDGTKYWWACEPTTTLHCWWEWKKKILHPTGNKAGQFITNSDPLLLYDLRISYLEFALGNIKPLPGQTWACMSRSSSLLLTTKMYSLPTIYGVCPYNGMLLIDKNEWTIDTWNSRIALTGAAYWWTNQIQKLCSLQCNAYGILQKANQ